MTTAAAVMFVLRDMVWSGVAALGFAMLFNVPVRTLLACALGGAVGHIIRTLLMKWGVSIEAATLAGAIVVGFLGELFARYWHAPAPVFTVPAVIPMVPGTFAYRTMIGILELSATTTGVGMSDALLVETAINASKTLLILIAIAIGIAAPALLAFHRQPAPASHVAREK